MGFRKGYRAGGGVVSGARYSPMIFRTTRFGL